MKLNEKRRKAIALTWVAVVIGLVVASALIFWAWPVAALFDATERYGWRWATLLWWWRGPVERSYWPYDVKVQSIWHWGVLLWQWGQRWMALPGEWWRTPLHLVGPPAGMLVGLVLWRLWVQPHDYDRTEHGFARKAEMRDLKRLKLFDSTGFILCQYKGRWVRNWETLSAILIAPPGTGKTVQLICNVLANWPDMITRPELVVWALVQMGVAGAAAWWLWTQQAWLAGGLVGALAGLGGWLLVRGVHSAAKVPAPSMVIHDVKGEIFDTTGGWRSTLGPVWTLSWMDPVREGDPTVGCFNLLDLDNFTGGDLVVPCRRRLAARLAPLFGEMRGPDEGNPEEDPGGFKSAADKAVPTLLRFKRDSGLDWWDLLLENPAQLGPLAAPPPADKPADDAPATERAEWARREAARWEGIDEPARTAWVQSELKRWGEVRLDGRTLQEDVIEYQNLMSGVQTVIDRQMTIFVSDQVETHWRSTGRAAGAGLVLWHIERCLRLGRVASYGALLDELAEVTLGGGGFTPVVAEIVEKVDDGGVVYKTREVKLPYRPSADLPGGQEVAGNVDGDKLAVLLERWIEEARTYGYSDRVIAELGQLLKTPDKERGSVISTFGSSIAVFKNPNVRERTSRSTFRVRDLRGWKGPGAMNLKRGDPCTVYIIIKLEDAAMVGPVTAAFIDLVANTFLSQPSKEVKKGRPIQFWLDEFWALPQMKSTMTIVTLGRGQWLQLYLIGQSLGQLAMQFTGAAGAAIVDVMKDAVAYVLVPTQASLKTAEEISKTIGNATVPNVSVSGQPAWQKGIPGFFSSNQNTSWTGLPLYSPQDILNFEKLDPTKNAKGQQLAMIYGMKALPVEGRPPTWFWDPILKRRANWPVRDWTAPPAAANNVADGGDAGGEASEPKGPSEAASRWGKRRS